MFVLIGPHVSQDHREAEERPHEQLSGGPLAAHTGRLYEERTRPHREDRDHRDGHQAHEAPARPSRNLPSR